jgi:hypothetical protein
VRLDGARFVAVEPMVVMGREDSSSYQPFGHIGRAERRAGLALMGDHLPAVVTPLPDPASGSAAHLPPLGHLWVGAFVPRCRAADRSSPTGVSTEDRPGGSLSEPGNGGTTRRGNR